MVDAGVWRTDGTGLKLVDEQLLIEVATHTILKNIEW